MAAIFTAVKMTILVDLFNVCLILDQNIDCGYSLELPLCFRAKIRKNNMYTPVLLYESEM